MEPPAPNLLPDPFRCTGTDGGREAHKQLAVTIADQARPETIAQEVKLLGNLSIVLLAGVTTNDLRFVRMKLKFAFSKASF